MMRRWWPIAIAALIYGAFVLWHDLPQKPLTHDEIEQGFREARAALQQHGREPMPQLHKQLKALLSEDDGQAFIMANLMRYRTTAVYPPGSGFSGTAREAEARYNRHILPQLLRHGSYPVFASDVAGSFIKDTGDTDWQSVALVRYRSRRDLLQMAIALAKADADVHKWAALEKTQVFPVRPFFTLNFLRLLVALVIFTPAIFLSLRRWRQ